LELVGIDSVHGGRSFLIKQVRHKGTVTEQSGVDCPMISALQTWTSMFVAAAQQNCRDERIIAQGCH